MAEFWFNTTTGEVEEGRVSDWAVVLGPYPTREAATRALDSARARSAAWDREDQEWSDAAGDARHDAAAAPSSDAGHDEAAGPSSSGAE